MSELLALGISHKTAPVALRERLAFSEHEASEFALAATATAEVREAVVISTCNRTEVYLVVGDGAGGSLVKAESDVLGLLAGRAEIRPTELAEAIYSPRNCDAARQLYRVTAGLESMILGEAEIQGQVRRAHESAMRAGCTGPLSNRLFAAALHDRQARALGDRDRLQPRERPVGGRRSGAKRARWPGGPPRGDPRRRRDQRADRARARRAGRRDDLRRQPPRRPGAQPRTALRRVGRRPGQTARPARARRHRAVLHLLSASDPRARGARAGDGQQRGGRARWC